MNTIKISVKTNRDANLLLRLLKSLNFVTEVEQIQEPENKRKENQFQKINSILHRYAKPDLFEEIKDPVRWQKSLRDEWA